MIDLVKARALCAAATPGPWTMWESEDQNLGPSVQGVMPSPAHPPLLHIVVDLHAEEGDAGYWPVIMTQDDAAFITSARTLLPEALDEIERLNDNELLQQYIVERDLARKAEAERDALKAEVELIRDLHKRAVDERARLRTLLRSLLNKVNRVTAPYRHGNPVIPAVLAELAQRQIDVEAALAAPQTGGDDD